MAVDAIGSEQGLTDDEGGMVIVAVAGCSWLSSLPRSGLFAWHSRPTPSSWKLRGKSLDTCLVDAEVSLLGQRRHRPNRELQSTGPTPCQPGAPPISQRHPPEAAVSPHEQRLTSSLRISRRPWPLRSMSLHEEKQSHRPGRALGYKKDHSTTRKKRLPPSRRA